MRYKSIEANSTFKLKGQGKCLLTNVGNKAILECKQRSLRVLGDMGDEVIVHSFKRPIVDGNTGYNITCHIYDKKGHYLESHLINPLGEAHLSTRNLPIGALPRLVKTRRNSLAPETLETEDTRSCCVSM